MGSNRKLLFGVLLVVGAVVFWGLFRIISTVNSASTPTPAPTITLTSDSAASRHQVAYAKVDIPQGSLVTKDMYEMKNLLGGQSTAGDYVTDPSTQADGYVTKVAIPKNNPIRPSDDFVGHITEVGVGGMLRPGYRAITVPFATKPTLHDLVHIGNFIDINAAFDGQEARTIVPSVRVLAVDVYGSDFPQVNIAARGPFKADLKGSAAPVVTAPGEPGATPTPTPAPAQAPARPDPAVTLEVTPSQANAILLAQASGATIDFVVLPAAPANQLREPGIVPGQDGQASTDTSGFQTVSVTKAKLAPYAESKKNSNAAAAAKSDPTGLKGLINNLGKLQKPVVDHMPEPYLPPTAGTTSPTTPFVPGPSEPAASPTYDIPIYADGKTVRVETVRRPQDY